MQSIPDLFRRAVERFGSQPAVGQRNVIKVETVRKTIEKDGKDYCERYVDTNTESVPMADIC